MGFEVWIVIVLLASALSGGIGYAFARKDAPKQSEYDAMTAELEEARQQAESVQADVSEHFEQSAMLFGKLAADYREFLDHFQSSAQSLGLSEARARELIEQGFQPLLTHEQENVLAEEATEAAEASLGEDFQTEDDVQTEEGLTTEPADSVPTAEIGEVTVELPDDPATAGDTEEDERQAAGSQDPERQRA